MNKSLRKLPPPPILVFMKKCKSTVFLVSIGHFFTNLSPICSHGYISCGSVIGFPRSPFSFIDGCTEDIHTNMMSAGALCYRDR